MEHTKDSQKSNKKADIILLAVIVVLSALLYLGVKAIF
jgi:hypothetical protein